MTKILIDEATVKQVLEALKQIDDAMPFPVAKLAQAALREALVEQPAQQSCYCLNCEKLSKQVTALKTCLEVERGFHAQEQPAQQEPFGYFKAEPFGWTDCAETDEGAVALYTSPQPVQRTWVGLSYEEAKEIYTCIHGYDSSKRIAEAIEAKLRELNQ